MLVELDDLATKDALGDLGEEDLDGSGGPHHEGAQRGSEKDQANDARGHFHGNAKVGKDSAEYVEDTGGDGNAALGDEQVNQQRSACIQKADGQTGDNDGAHEGLDATLKVVKEHADRLSAANALDDPGKRTEEAPRSCEVAHVGSHVSGSRSRSELNAAKGSSQGQQDEHGGQAESRGRTEGGNGADPLSALGRNPRGDSKDDDLDNGDPQLRKLGVGTKEHVARVDDDVGQDGRKEEQVNEPVAKCRQERPATTHRGLNPCVHARLGVLVEADELGGNQGIGDKVQKRGEEERRRGC